MYNICFYFLMFYCFSIFGWIVECIDQSIVKRKFVHDRGFLIGTYCPIYGCGAMYMHFFLSRYYDEPVALFTMAVVGTSLIEYVTSYIMEKMFKARWWDYSDKKFNIEGRVYLKNSILFGILGVVFIYILDPLFIYFIEKIPETILIVVSIILFVTFLIDIILTFSIMKSLKNKLSNIRKDSTSEIDKQVKEALSKHTFYINKLFNAFPKVKFSFPTGEKILESVKRTLDNMNVLKKERRKSLKKLKNELKKKESKK